MQLLLALLLPAVALGAVAMTLLLVIITPMSWSFLKYRLPFELRISLHAGRTVELLLVGSMLTP